MSLYEDGGQVQRGCSMEGTCRYGRETGWKDGGSCPHSVVLKVRFLLIFRVQPHLCISRPCLNPRELPSQVSTQPHEGDLSSQPIDTVHAKPGLVRTGELEAALNSSRRCLGSSKPGSCIQSTLLGALHSVVYALVCHRQAGECVCKRGLRKSVKTLESHI